MNNITDLTTAGEIKIGNKSQFTRLVGGFGNDKPVITARQVAEFLGYKNGASTVNLTVLRNIDKFDEGVHIIDLKSVLSERKNENTFKTLQAIGYSQNSMNRSKNVFVFSEAGFLLFLKFAEGDKAVEAYKSFIEDYFQTKANNKMLSKTIEQELEELMNDKANALGRMCMTTDESKRIALVGISEDINRRIVDLQTSIAENNMVESLSPEIYIADVIERANKCYTIGSFAKVLAVRGMGRNKTYKWLREKNIIMKDNEPYQSYMKYFTIVPAGAKGSNSQTLLNPTGVKYIVKRMIEDGILITKPIDTVLEELKLRSVVKCNE